LMQTKVTELTTKVPILGDIPLLGWLFKNKRKTEIKSNVLILISSRIINPERTDISGPITQARANEYRNDLASLTVPATQHDPVDKLFFTRGSNTSAEIMNNFIFKRHDNSLSENDLTTQEMSRDQRRKKARKEKKLAQLEKRKANAQSTQEATSYGLDTKEIGV